MFHHAPVNLLGHLHVLRSGDIHHYVTGGTKHQTCCRDWKFEAEYISRIYNLFTETRPLSRLPAGVTPPRKQWSCGGGISRAEIFHDQLRRMRNLCRVYELDTHL